MREPKEASSPSAFAAGLGGCVFHLAAFLLPLPPKPQIPLVTAEKTFREREEDSQKRLLCLSLQREKQTSNTMAKAASAFV